MTFSDDLDADSPAWRDQIPTLTETMVVQELPQALRLMLEARAAEKRALMALADDLARQLQPEVERMTRALVNKTLNRVWAQRASAQSVPPAPL